MKKPISILLSMLMILSCIQPLAMSTFAISSSDMPEGFVLTSSTPYNICPGVVEEHIVTVDKNGNNQNKSYVAILDFSSGLVSAMAGYKDYDSSGTWGMQTVRDQARKAEEKTGKNIVVAINADYYNMATGEPTNHLVMGGKIVHRSTDPNSYYFAVLKDGTPVIRNSTEPLDDVWEAVGSPFPLVIDGQVQESLAYDTYAMPRNAVGVTADGKVIVMVNDGRQAPKSVGYTSYEIAKMMKAYGCVDAVYLDGGGSATYASKSEGTNTLTVKNSPSDGNERLVSDTLLFYSTAKPDGEFDHASLSPVDKLYTPYSTVQFTATGVDQAGAPAELPADGFFALEDDSYGTITADGEFVSNGKTGKVTVNYISDEKIVGSATIKVVIPDEISFSSEEVSLGFEAVSDLGLTVKYQAKDVVYKDGDIIWEMTNSELGSVNGNIFTSSDGKTLNGDVTATLAYNDAVTGKVHVIVGLLPTVVWDFEDVDIKDEEGNITGTIPAADYYTGENGILTHGNYGRGGKESIEIVSIDDEEPVRFGSHALKLNYDFTECGAVTEGAIIGTSDEMPIPGNPTGIGCWVYAPEGTGITYEGPGTQAGLWLRGYVLDCVGTVKPYDFTLEPKAVLDSNGNWTGVQPGSYWEGWMYCEADLTAMTGPFSIQQGNTLRLMFVAGTGMGTRTAGAIYFDNLQFVYGTNVDDVDNPVVDSITVNNEELKDGAVIKTNTINVDGYFHDVENKYTTGIDPSTVRMYLDGVNVADNDYFQYATDPDGSKNHLYNAYLLNGQHSVTVSVRDGFGNETTETRYFTVDGEASDAPTVSVGTVEDSAVLGKKISVSIDASDASVLTNSTGLTFGNQFKDYEVTFGDNFDGSYSYNKLTKTLTVTGTNKGGDDTHIATVSFTVPKTLNASQKFTYTVKSGLYEVGDKSYTYSAKEAAVAVSAPYTVSAKPMLVGLPGTIVVTDNSGNAAQGVSVYYGETVVGVTDENGEIVTDIFTQTSGNYEVFAMDNEGNVSFIFKVGSYDINGESSAPFGIMNNAVKDPTTMKAVNWISSPKAPAQVLQYKVEGAEEWTTVEASSELQTFTKGGNSAANFNGTVLTGLTPATTYEYRVGSEEAYSDVLTFTTSEKTEKTKFFVLGDMQSEDITNISALSDMISKGNYNFGIQTGDMVDDTTLYSSWVDVTTLLGVEKFGSVDTLHVLGNHEYAGDATGEKAKALYSLQESVAGSAYSATYGNVYVAVINYSGNSKEYKEALDWVVEDAKASNATWKILALHQPAYYTNNVGGNGDVHALVPPAVDEADIDFVFAGHDHSYARTAPMTGGKVNEDGAVYFICGSSGEKKYDVTNNDDFNFEIATQNYDGVYLSIETTKHTFDVKTYNADGALLDQYSTIKNVCENGLHTYTYTSDGYLICSACDFMVKADESDHTGMIKDAETGVAMYLISGVPQTSRWITNGDDYYYLGADGKALTGVQEVTDADGVTRTYTFDETGLNIAGSFVEEEVTNPANGEKRTITRYYFGGTYLRRWNEIDGSTYYFYRTNNIVPVYNEGEMFTGTRTVKTSQKNTIRTFVFSEDGKLLVGALEDETDINGNYTGTRYYWGDNYMTDTTVDVNGFEYTLDENGYVTNKTDLASCKITLSATSGNYSGSAKKPTVTVKLGDKVLIKGQHYTVSYENNKEVGTAKVIVTGCKSVIGTKTLSYTIKPSKPTSLKTKVSGSSIVLTWTASKGASDYKVYRSTSLDGKYSELATVSGKTTYTDKTASPATTYYYKVRAYKAVDGKTYNSNYSDAVSSRIPLGNASGLKATATAYNKVKLTFNAVDGATGYAVYRSTSKDGKYSRIGTASKASYTDATVKTGTKYYYKVRAFKTEGSSTEYSAYTSVVSAKTALSTVTGLKVSSTAYNKVTLKWTAVSGATSYAVYRSTSKNGTYKRIGTATKNSFSDTSVKTGTKYYYKVRAIIKVDKTNIYSAYSSAVSATPALAKATVKSVTASGKTVNIKWSKVSGASGYAIYQASSKTGSLKRIKTVKSGSTTAFATKVSKSGTYYYVVKAYRTVGSKNVYGAASSRVSVKVR